MADQNQPFPEKPLGAATGVNLDEHGRARFTTISGVPVNPSPAQVGYSIEAQAGSESIKMRLRRENEQPEMRNSTRKPDSLVFIGRSCGKLSFSAVPGKEV